MRRQILLLSAALLLLPAASAEPEFKIRQTCQADEVNLLSMYNRKGGNIAKPGYYKWQICATGIEEANIRQTCQSDENSLISMYRKTDSHASVFDTYRWDLCVPELQVSAVQTCDNPMASIRLKDDTHLAEPGHFKREICPSFPEPENITLKFTTSGDQVYVSGEKAEERTYNAFELDYPYIVTGQPAGIVSYGEFVKLEYQNKSKNVFKLTQTGESFLLPFTRGGYEEIEDEDSAVSNRELINRLSPSFGFNIPENPTIKIAYQSDYRIHGFAGSEYSSLDLAVRNRLDSDNTTDIIFRPQ